MAIARRQLALLMPALLLAAGILLSSLLAVRHAEWLVLAAPLALALSVPLADMLQARLRGLPARPSPGALTLAVSFLLAGQLVAVQDPGFLKQLMPSLAALAAVTLSQWGRRRTACETG